MNLSQRLQSELIDKGLEDVVLCVFTPEPDDPKHCTWCGELTFSMRHKIKPALAEALPEVVAAIAADLKGMLDKDHAADCLFWSRPGGSASAYCTCPIDDAKKDVDRFCGLTGEEKVE
jgi:hypothetical protein